MTNDYAHDPKAEGATDKVSHPQSTATGSPCAPGCALYCVLDRHVSLLLADHLEAGPAERLAWLLVGLGDRIPPLPEGRYRDVFATAAARYGTRVVAEALESVARRPIPHGVPVDRARIEALAAAWRRAEGVAA